VYSVTLYATSPTQGTSGARISYLSMPRGGKHVPGGFFTTLTRVRHTQSLSGCSNRIPSLWQGTKILDNREIRRRYSVSTKDTPPQHCSSYIVKYTGALTSPEWKDVDLCRVFSLSLYFTQSQKDKFRKLCRVEAGIFCVPYTTKFAGIRKRAYERNYDIILFMDLRA